MRTAEIAILRSTRCMRIFECSCLVAMALSVLPVASSAVPVVVDQANDQFRDFSGFVSIDYAEPLGQEFVPQFDSLDFVVLLVNTSIQPQGSAPELSVRIREGSISGVILGASQVLTPPSGFVGAIFTFPVPVSLTPGSIYVIEILEEREFGGQSFLPTPFVDTYSPGRAIFQGEPYAEGEDIWFQEGFGIPEPSSITLIAFGLLALGVHGRLKSASSAARSFAGA